MGGGDIADKRKRNKLYYSANRCQTTYPILDIDYVISIVIFYICKKF